MSKIHNKRMFCIMCGRESNHRVMRQPYASGSPDLDRRPPEPARSAMQYLVHQCPYCGYANHDLFELLSDEDNEIVIDRRTVAALMSTERYRTCGGHELPESAVRFYRAHLIAEEFRYMTRSLRMIQCAIWTCDDLGCVETARALRHEAAEVAWGVLFMYGAVSYVVIIADLYRRSGEFDEAEGFLREQIYKLDEDFTLPLAKFELKLIARKDAAIHTIDEAFAQEEE